MLLSKNRQEYDALGFLWLDRCPFCNIENQEEYIVWKGRYWYIARNMLSYSWTEKHVMAIPYKHRIFSHELDSDEILELGEIHRFIASFFGKEEYFSCTRESIANRSVEHIHMHFIPGRLKWIFLRKMLEMQGFPIHEELILD